MWVEISRPPPPLGIASLPPCEVTDGFGCQQTTTAAAFGCFAFVLKQNGLVGFFGAPLCSSGSHFFRVIKEIWISSDSQSWWNLKAFLCDWKLVLCVDTRLKVIYVVILEDLLASAVSCSRRAGDPGSGGVLSQTVMGLRGALLTQWMFGIHFQPSMFCHICVA